MRVSVPPLTFLRSGLLDVIFLSNGKAYAVGGGGTIFQSSNGGQSWVKDKV